MQNLKLIGALTSKPYAFTARSWELKNVETIDLFDSLGSNIKVDIRGSEIMRILPINNDFINEEWISDKTRFAYDGLKRWRFITPLIKKNDMFIQSSWKEVFEVISKKIKNTNFNNIIVQTGNYTDLETLTAVDTFVNKLPGVLVNNDLTITSDKQNYFLDAKEFNNISGEKIYILVGINLRLENPVLNIKLRRLSLQNNVLVAFIGAKYDYNINLYHLGNSFKTVKEILSGKHPFVPLLNTFLKKRKIKNTFKNSITWLVGTEFINQQQKFQDLIIQNYSTNKLNFNVSYLAPFSGVINALELGLSSPNKQILDQTKPNLFYLIESENITQHKPNDFIIFQGSHNDLIRTKFDIILPTNTWVEKSSLFLNCFGMIQRTNTILNSPQLSRLGWKVVRMISIIFGKDINYNDIYGLHQKLENLSPNILSKINDYKIPNKYNINYKNSKTSIQINLMPYKSFIPNFYNNTSIERSSKILNECSNTLEKNINNFLK